MTDPTWLEHCRHVMKKDAIVLLRLYGCDAEWVRGRIAIVSGNLQSVGVMLDDGMVGTAGGGLVGPFVPLMADFERGTLTGLDGSEYELAVRKEGVS